MMECISDRISAVAASIAAASKTRMNGPCEKKKLSVLLFMMINSCEIN